MRSRSSLTTSLSTHFPPLLRSPTNSLIAPGSETHSGKDDALCRILPKIPPPPLTDSPSRSSYSHARYLARERGVISALPSFSPSLLFPFVHLYPSSKSNVDDALEPSLPLRKPFVSRELSSIFHAFPRPIPTSQPTRDPSAELRPTAIYKTERQTATCNSQRDGKFIDGN